MTTYNPSTFDWNDAMLPSISSLDENDFLALLQKQFQSTNPLTPARPAPPMNPQSLSLNAAGDSTPPLSNDSSPSPPSTTGAESSERARKNGHKSVDNMDEGHKRKKSVDGSDDDLDEQPSSKSQHTDKRGGNKRKSTGDKPQDESKLLKRKEQNRAAQRAFRERKEKHVKDLEDKVAELEAKTQTQSVENDNLRDMLGRLQSENMMLKQTPFTFSVPSTSSAPAPRSNDDDDSPEPLNLFTDTIGDSSSSNAFAPGPPTAATSTHDSPSSLFSAPQEDNGNMSGYDMDTIALFGGSGPFTTVASNPMYASYRDSMSSLNMFNSFPGVWDGSSGMSTMPGTSGSGAGSLGGLFGEEFDTLFPTANSSAPTPSSASRSPVGHAVSPNSLPPTEPHQKTNQCPRTKEDVEHAMKISGMSSFVNNDIPMGDASSEPITPVGHPVESVSFDNLWSSIGPNGNGASKETEKFNIDILCSEMQRKAKCSGGGC